MMDSTCPAARPDLRSDHPEVPGPPDRRSADRDAGDLAMRRQAVDPCREPDGGSGQSAAPGLQKPTPDVQRDRRPLRVGVA